MLTRAIQDFETGMSMPSWHPAIALAELRIRQDRLSEAEMLLLGKEGHLQALLPAARLHLARGDHDLARATAARGLRAVGADRLRGAELLAVLVDVELAVGHHDAAFVACDELVARTGELDIPGMRARTISARGRVLAAGGDVAGAIAMVESAADRLSSAGVPVLRAALMVDLARYHDRLGNRAAARVEAKQAAAALAPLDVVLPAASLALLRRLGALSPDAPTAHLRATLSRKDRWWVVACDGNHVRMGDTKGLRYLAELLASPGVERHVLDLVDRVEGTSVEPGLDRRRLGDAGGLVDPRARAAYRRRVEDLRAEIDDTLGVGADARAEALQAELDELVGHLAQAFGLGGRGRRAASAVERARLNVTRALRTAVARVSDALPEGGGELDRRVRTGLYCAYQPGTDDTVQWVVHS